MCILKRADDICLYIIDTTTMRPRALLKKKNSNFSCRYPSLSVEGCGNTHHMAVNNLDINIRMTGPIKARPAGPSTLETLVHFC